MVEGVITSCCKALEDWVIRRVTVVKTNKAKGMIKDRISRCHSSRHQGSQRSLKILLHVGQDTKGSGTQQMLDGGRLRKWWLVVVEELVDVGPIGSKMQRNYN